MSEESTLQRRKAIYRYMALKGLNVGSGKYDEVIVIWDEALSKYRDEDMIDMCGIAATEPGRVTLHEFLEATEAWLDNRYRMRNQ